MLGQHCMPVGATMEGPDGVTYTSAGRAPDGRCVFRDPSGQLVAFQAQVTTTVKSGLGSGTKAAIVIGGLVALTAIVEHGID